MHTHTLAQEIADARRIRNQILTNFELSTQPNLSDDEKRRLLHFVVVGGGPTGVEFGAEFYDFFKQVCYIAIVLSIISVDHWFF